MRTLLIADMHLSNDTPELNQGFYRYLEHTAKGAEDLYILGDLFDAWIETTCWIRLTPSAGWPMK